MRYVLPAAIVSLLLVAGVLVDYVAAGLVAITIVLWLAAKRFWRTYSHVPMGAPLELSARTGGVATAVFCLFVVLVLNLTDTESGVGHGERAPASADVSEFTQLIRVGADMPQFGQCTDSNPVSTPRTEFGRALSVYDPALTCPTVTITSATLYVHYDERSGDVRQELRIEVKGALRSQWLDTQPEAVPTAGEGLFLRRATPAIGVLMADRFILLAEGDGGVVWSAEATNALTSISIVIEGLRSGAFAGGNAESDIFAEGPYERVVVKAARGHFVGGEGFHFSFIPSKFGGVFTLVRVFLPARNVPELVLMALVFGSLSILPALTLELVKSKVGAVRGGGDSGRPGTDES